MSLHKNKKAIRLQNKVAQNFRLDFFPLPDQGNLNGDSGDLLRV